MEASSTLALDVVKSLKAIAGDIEYVFSQIAPIALAIAGTYLVWRYGIRFFKSISK